MQRKISELKSDLESSVSDNKLLQENQRSLEAIIKQTNEVMNDIKSDFTSKVRHSDSVCGHDFAGKIFSYIYSSALKAALMKISLPKMCWKNISKILRCILLDAEFIFLTLVGKFSSIFDKRAHMLAKRSLAPLAN